MGPENGINTQASSDGFQPLLIKKHGSGGDKWNINGDGMVYYEPNIFYPIFTLLTPRRKR